MKVQNEYTDQIGTIACRLKLPADILTRNRKALYCCSSRSWRFVARWISKLFLLKICRTQWKESSTYWKDSCLLSCVWRARMCRKASSRCYGGCCWCSASRLIQCETGCRIWDERYLIYTTTIHKKDRLLLLCNYSFNQTEHYLVVIIMFECQLKWNC